MGLLFFFNNQDWSSFWFLWLFSLIYRICPAISYSVLAEEKQKLLLLKNGIFMSFWRVSVCFGLTIARKSETKIPGRLRVECQQSSSAQACSPGPE